MMRQSLPRSHKLSRLLNPNSIVYHTWPMANLAVMVPWRQARLEDSLREDHIWHSEVIDTITGAIVAYG